MILRICDIPEFIHRVQGKEVVCFGAGGWLNILSTEFTYRVESTFSYIVDSNEELWGTKRVVGEKELEVFPPQFLYATATETTVLLISNGSYSEIKEILDTRTELEKTECYIAPLIHSFEMDKLVYSVPAAPNDYRQNQKPIIPKNIHYTWFSGQPLPQKALDCIESWKRFCPTYEIIEWNRDNYDLAKHPYMNQAIDAKKWGFAGDYARLDIILNYGGFYFDLDVELLKSIDELRHNSAFLGFETYTTVNVGSGFGAIKGHHAIRKLRDSYDNVKFQDENGKLNLDPSPKYQSATMISLGLDMDGTFQIIDDIVVYPAEYFCPKSLLTERLHITPNTYSIHNFDGSWLSHDERSLNEAKKSIKREAINNEEQWRQN